ncbi:MAG: hypothetical protein JW908_14070 [Anaerolineales bacterium]|nr:hypothetical protein [Anaerolineales bacterium]
MKTGKFSVFPKRLDANYLQLGFVEIAKTDIFRDAIIGGAPLIFGSMIVAYIGLVHLDLSMLWFSIWNRSLPESFSFAQKIYAIDDFWIWFYLIVVISSTMLPSKSDRRAWLPISLLAICLFGICWFFGGSSWIKSQILPWIGKACESVSAVFLISIVAYVVIIIPLILIRKTIFRRFT